MENIENNKKLFLEFSEIIARRFQNLLENYIGELTKEELEKNVLDLLKLSCDIINLLRKGEIKCKKEKK